MPTPQIFIINFSHVYPEVSLIILVIAIALPSSLFITSILLIILIVRLIWRPPPPPPPPPPPLPLLCPVKIQSIPSCDLPSSLRRRKLRPQPDDGEPAYPSKSHPLGRSTAVDHH
ncbi:hypothetical protein N7488_005766 [Penicillium malachiteum]|nr:hypothetical protein N7488_005766 [Penicillium malachiteum]